MAMLPVVNVAPGELSVKIRQIVPEKPAYGTVIVAT
jgi:hypothetical protein